MSQDIRGFMNMLGVDIEKFLKEDTKTESTINKRVKKKVTAPPNDMVNIFLRRN